MLSAVPRRVYSLSYGALAMALTETNRLHVSLRGAQECVAHKAIVFSLNDSTTLRIVNVSQRAANIK